MSIRKFFTKEEREQKKAEVEKLRQDVRNGSRFKPSERLYNLEQFVLAVDGLNNWNFAWIQRYKNTEYLKQPRDNEGWKKGGDKMEIPKSDEKTDGFFAGATPEEEGASPKKRAKQEDKFDGVTNDQLERMTH